MKSRNRLEGEPGVGNGFNGHVITSIHPDGIDGFEEKARRHLIGAIHGYIEWQTIKRGLLLLPRELLTRYIDSSVITNTEIIHDAFGIEDLCLTTLTVAMPIVDHLNCIKREERVKFVDFPSEASLGIELHDEGSKERIFTGDIFRSDSDIIAAFTGATSSHDADYPNNGFYHQDRLYKPFEPAKSRKGALAIFDNGKTVLVDDDGKQTIIENQFSGVTSLVGTSFYITDNDSQDNEDINRYNGRSRISYLLQYTLPDGSVRMGFVLATMGTRRKMKEWIDDYCGHRGSRSYIAVELERDLAGCFIKQGDKTVSLAGGGFHVKPEHYVIRKRGLSSGL